MVCHINKPIEFIYKPILEDDTIIYFSTKDPSIKVYSHLTESDRVKSVMTNEGQHDTANKHVSGNNTYIYYSKSLYSSSPILF